MFCFCAPKNSNSYSSLLRLISLIARSKQSPIVKTGSSTLKNKENCELPTFASKIKPTTHAANVKTIVVMYITSPQ